jgi:hypothetical protein
MPNLTFENLMPEAPHGVSVARNLLGFDARPLRTIEPKAVDQPNVR